MITRITMIYVAVSDARLRTHDLMNYIAIPITLD